ncbi:SIS domain-containing protein [Candidatus Bathyarchaeota archaeon]|nr:SIS domain-containing protein [Candidatus Bathyarchaeota archaeon]MBS7613280.1 SIS domain-containing protein [Candidatus Bathyarchaeota archaeon]MBS7618662.1 SIS domain-containing protein [Candidatus Bathyarchaeota archaeon]
MSLFLDEMFGQPRAVRDTVASYLDTRGEVENLVERLNRGGFKRIVMTGMGNSYYALLPSWIKLNKAGFNAQMIETSELLYYMLDVLKDSIMVVISRSGETVEIVKLLEATPKNAFIVAVTDNPKSTLASKSNLVIPTRAGEEHLAASKSHLALLAALHMLSADFTREDIDSEKGKLLKVAGIIENYQRRVLDESKQIGGKLAKCNSIIIVSRGPTVSSAYTGALVMKEMAKIHCEGCSAAQFRHGPMEMLSSTTGVIVMSGPKETRRLNVKMAFNVAEFGSPTVLIDYSKEDNFEKCMLIKVDEPPDSYTDVLVELPPIYTLTYHIALERGAPLKFVKTGKVTYVE